ncbi:MAG: hypothetical protein KBC35_00955 [Candidatus Pacebacteria bacterium]|nr:hypothetical protein [Candidatus Paceibacterota bacterium]
MAQAQTGITGNKTPAPATTQTGIAGNNSGQIGQATTARAKAHDKSVYFHAAVALVLLVLGVTLAGQNLSFFWKLVVGIAFIIVGGNIATVKGYDKYRATWPQIIRGLGWVVVVATLLMSGIGQWTGSVAKSVDTAAFCAVEENKNDARCKKATVPVQQVPVVQIAQPGARESTIVDAAVPPDSPTSATVPACGQGWAKVDIPPGWNITMGWNEAASTYEWRSVKTGNWESDAAGGADAVRFCAKHKPYAGDTMRFTWKKM